MPVLPWIHVAAVSAPSANAMGLRAGVGAATVSTTIRDVQASYTMEGGEVLPEPGSPEEERWKALGTAVRS